MMNMTMIPMLVALVATVVVQKNLSSLGWMVRVSAFLLEELFLATRRPGLSLKPMLA